MSVWHDGAILIGLVRASLSGVMTLELRPRREAIEKSRTIETLSSGWTLESPRVAF